jgi:hypothetical protein
MEVSPRVRWSNGMSKIIVHAYSYPKACRVLCIAFFFFVIYVISVLHMHMHRINFVFYFKFSLKKKKLLLPSS